MEIFFTAWWALSYLADLAHPGTLCRTYLDIHLTSSENELSLFGCCPMVMFVD